jgi:hypothetical protein
MLGFGHEVPVFATAVPCHLTGKSLRVVLCSTSLPWAPACCKAMPVACAEHWQVGAPVVLVCPAVIMRWSGYRGSSPPSHHAAVSAGGQQVRPPLAVTVLR